MAMPKPKPTTKSKGYTPAANAATGFTTGVKKVSAAKGKPYSPPAKPKFQASLSPAQKAALQADSARAAKVGGKGIVNVNGKFPVKGLGLFDSPLVKLPKKGK